MQLNTRGIRSHRGNRGSPSHRIFERLQVAYYSTRDSIHNGVHIPHNQRSERFYYALISSWAQVVYHFDALKDAAQTIPPSWPRDPTPGNGFLLEQVLRCESHDYRPQECRIPGRILEVRLLDQRSRARCDKGRSFGYRGNILWVNEGCAADFRVTFGR